MYLLTNKLNREVALPAPCGSVVLQIGECRKVQDEHYAELIKSAYSQQAINSGAVVVDRLDEVQQPEQPQGVELISQGFGMWTVSVNGHVVTDKPVRKKEAQRIAAEYEVVPELPESK